jgi:hypothetical protein
MKGFLIFILAFFLVSCQALPKIIDAPVAPKGKDISICPSPFLKQKQRLIHTIEVHMPAGIRSAIIGVTLADPNTRSVSSAIMTAEGVVLFEAEENMGSLKVIRALPPFDSEDFAKNMIDDIKLIFFTPQGKIHQAGVLPDGAAVCRWRKDDGSWIDVSSGQQEDMEIKRYSTGGVLKRHVKFNKKTGDNENIYQKIELHAKELSDYSLFMTLIEAQAVKN